MPTHAVDIDECADGTHGCSAEEVCVNLRGHYVCRRREVDTAPDDEDTGSDLSTTAYTRDKEEPDADYDVVVSQVLSEAFQCMQPHLLWKL